MRECCSIAKLKISFSISFFFFVLLLIIVVLLCCCYSCCFCFVFNKSLLLYCCYCIYESICLCCHAFLLFCRQKFSSVFKVLLSSSLSRFFFILFVYGCRGVYCHRLRFSMEIKLFLSRFAAAIIGNVSFLARKGKYDGI